MSAARVTSVLLSQSRSERRVVASGWRNTSHLYSCLNINSIFVRFGGARRETEMWRGQNLEGTTTPVEHGNAHSSFAISWSTALMDVQQNSPWPALIMGVACVAGGTAGYMRTGSKPSLIAGVSVGILYLWSGSALLNGDARGITGAMGEQTLFSRPFLTSCTRRICNSFPLLAPSRLQGTGSCHVDNSLRGVGLLLLPSIQSVAEIG